MGSKEFRYRWDWNPEARQVVSKTFCEDPEVVEYLLREGQETLLESSRAA